MLFAIKHSDFLIKHRILDIYLEKYSAYEVKTAGSVYAIPFDFIPNCMSSTKLKNQTIRCIKSMIINKELDLIIKDGQHFISITKKGLDLYNSEELITLEMEERRKIVNNNYTIAFGVITCIGVLFAIFKDTLMNEGNKKQEIRIKIELPSKMLVHDSGSILIDTVIYQSPADSVVILKH